jgi:NAD(P)-dependent dehydrogenase (short-subunit alcohol dehydrogenase family)
MGTLDGKVAIITGAGQGLGAAHAKLFAAEGARLVLNDLGDGVEDVVAEINAAGGEAVANRTSVSDWNASREMIDQAVDTYGDLHILVNNAGILRDKMSFNMEEDEWDAVINVHLKGHFCPSRHAGTYWRSQSKSGHDAPRRIINTSSEAGLFGNAGQANYAAAKSGIATLAIVFGRELASYGVTGNAIAPRARTAMTDSMDFFSAPEDESQFDRFLPENISPLVAWLASDGAGDINGQVFVVIGGDVWVMNGWSISGHLHKDGTWTPEELAAKKEELFAEQDRTLPQMAVPSW